MHWRYFILPTPATTRDIAFQCVIQILRLSHCAWRKISHILKDVLKEWKVSIYWRYFHETVEWPRQNVRKKTAEVSLWLKIRLVIPFSVTYVTVENDFTDNLALAITWINRAWSRVSFPTFAIYEDGKIADYIKRDILYNHRLHAMLCKIRINSPVFFMFWYVWCHTHIGHIQKMSNICIGKDIQGIQMKIRVY